MSEVEKLKAEIERLRKHNTQHKNTIVRQRQLIRDLIQELEELSGEEFNTEGYEPY